MILVALRVVAAALLLAMSTAATTAALCAEVPVIPEIPAASSVTTARMPLSTPTAASPLTVAIVQRTLDGPLRRTIRHTLRPPISPSRFTGVPVVPGIPIVTAFERALDRTIIASIPIINTDVRSISNPVSNSVRGSIRSTIHVTFRTIAHGTIPTVGPTLRSAIRSSIHSTITIVRALHVAFFGTVRVTVNATVNNAIASAIRDPLRRAIRGSFATPV